MSYINIWICLFVSLYVSANGIQIKSVEHPVCGELGDCVANSDLCDKKCGCDTFSSALYYNETIEECVLDVKKLLESLSERRNAQEKIFNEVQRVFQGIIFSAVLFATCASMCVFVACYYCCRINFMDNRLKNDVDALKEKLKRENRYKKRSVKVAPQQQTAESCNIIVSDAGVYCV